MPYIRLHPMKFYPAVNAIRRSPFSQFYEIPSIVDLVNGQEQGSEDKAPRSNLSGEPPYFRIIGRNTDGGLVRKRLVPGSNEENKIRKWVSSGSRSPYHSRSIFNSPEAGCHVSKEDILRYFPPWMDKASQ